MQWGARNPSFPESDVLPIVRPPSRGETTKKGRSHDPKVLYWRNRSSSTTCPHIVARACQDFQRNTRPRISRKLFMPRRLSRPATPFPFASRQLIEIDGPASPGNFFPPQIFESELLQNVFRSGVAFFHVRLHAIQPQPCKRRVNKSLRRLRREPASPVRPRQIIPEARAHLVARSTQPATSDVLPFFFENGRPQSVGFRRIA